MTVNYNDGEWHEWNGTDWPTPPCPVHPKSIIDYVWHDELREEAGSHCGVTASPCVAWSQVVRFRVVKEYKEPREYWINIYPNYPEDWDKVAYPSKAQADRIGRSDRIDCIKVREVRE